VFEERNFIDILHWKKKKQPSFLRNHTAKVMEYILIYGKVKSLVSKLSVDKISDATKKVVNLTNNLSLRHFKKGVRVKIDDSGIIEKGKYTIKSMQVEYLQNVIYENGVTINEVDVKAQFSVSQEKIDEYIKDNLLFITVNKGLRRDVSEDEKQNEKAITDLLLDWGDNQDSEKEQQQLFGNIVFEYIKPIKLIYKLIKSSTEEDAIILDFFAGSGTTGQAVLELNASDKGRRQFILCTNNEITDTTPNGVVVDVTSKRLKRVMTGKCYDGTSNFEWAKKNKPLGGNLEVYDIATVANFEATAGKTPFDVIDETLYGQEKFDTVKEKTEWVCDNFEHTQKGIENDADWLKRKEEK
jgi:adenine specific DNA methylase Mod